MPAKGQSCKTCNGACCKMLIGFCTPKDCPDLTKQEYQSLSFSELKDFEYELIIEPEIKEVCKRLTKDGKCSVHGKMKPRLCKSFWCHGKLWKPKEELK